MVWSASTSLLSYVRYPPRYVSSASTSLYCSLNGDLHFADPVTSGLYKMLRQLRQRSGHLSTVRPSTAHPASAPYSSGLLDETTAHSTP